MTNLEGRVIFRRRSLPPPPQARSDLQVLHDLAERLGYGRHFPQENSVAFRELRQASSGGVADYAGISYERIIEEEGLFWPCPSEGHPGTPRLFLDQFATPDGRARFHPVEFHAAVEEPDREFPLYLTTGRVMAHYQSGTQTLRVQKLKNAVPEAFVEMHPAMALSYGIAQGDIVCLTTRRGTATAKAQLTTTIRLDTIFVPFHFAAHGRANLLTNPALDPTSRMPEFKVCAVRIAKASSC